MMPISIMSPGELERLAYIEGRTEVAKLYADLIDQEELLDEIDDLKRDLDKLKEVLDDLKEDLENAESVIAILRGEENDD